MRNRLDLASLPLRRAAEDLQARVGSQRWFRAASPWLSTINRARMAKRLSDILLSALGLLLFSPLFAVISVAILVTSGRPIFYSQERVGQGGRRFRIIKFRSMRYRRRKRDWPDLGFQP